MISDQERDDVWIFLDNCGVSIRVDVVVIDYPGNPGRSTFVTGVTPDGRIVYFENGQYLCDDGTTLHLPVG
jgi:hypothetical protein